MNLKVRQRVSIMNTEIKPGDEYGVDNSSRPVSSFVGMPSTSVDPSASRASDPHIERFWLSYFRTSFIVLIGEIAVGLVYFFLTPAGPHRGVLVALGLISVGIALAGFSVVHYVASLTWRSDIVIAWILYAGIVITLSAYLDFGIDSPLTVLFVLPLAAAALGISVRNVIICGFATLAELAFVWFTDPSKSSLTADMALLAATVIGMAVFALGITTARSRMQRDQTALEHELTFRAESDSLTGCLNHGAFYERLSVEIERSLRNHETLSLVMVDVDLFKAFNDAYGHVAGDDALAHIGKIFRNLSRSFDVVGRIGGDEFAVVLPHTSATDAFEIAVRLKEGIARECAPITVSMGSATLENTVLTATQLVRNADASLYRAKSNGRDRVVQSKRRDLTLGSGQSRHQTERRRADLRVAEERIRESDRATAEALSVLDAFQATTAVGLGFVDTDFRIVRINPMLASVGGGSVDEQIGRTIEEVVPALWPQLEPKYRSVVDSAMPVVNLEVSGTSADDADGTLWWLTNLYPVMVDEQVIGIGIVALDITDRKRLEQSRIDLTRSLVAALASAVEMRDPYTAGHEGRVSRSAVLVAKELGLSCDDIESIGLAGDIHDIWKLSVPAEILSRLGRSGPADRELIRTHWRAGAEMLERVEFPRVAREIVLQYNERIDGSGFPSGLKGDDLCLGAQIIAVADVFDAIVSDWANRPALGVDAALEELANGSGTKYNADVVTTFIRLVKANIIEA
jgi:diguanylate cyclase (GGDEF)-like protein/PAS domain S-box-containing protein